MKIITVSGGARCGKTVISNQIADELRKLGYTVHVWRHAISFITNPRDDVEIIDDPTFMPEHARNALMKDPECYNILLSSKLKRDCIHKDIIYHMVHPTKPDFNNLLEWLK